MPSKTPSILLGGAVLGLLIPFLGLVPVLGACLCCFAYIGAGMASTWHYTDMHNLTIRGGTGAGMGAASGAIAGFVAFLVTMILIGFGIVPGAEEVVRQLDEPEFREQIGPETAEELFRFIEMYYGPASAVVNVLVGSILGLIGGVIGASIFQKGGEAPSESTPPPVDDGPWGGPAS